MVLKQDESPRKHLLLECSKNALTLSDKINDISSFAVYGHKIFSFPHDIEDKLKDISSHPDRALKNLSNQDLNEFNQFLCSSNEICDETIETLADVRAKEDDLNKQLAPRGSFDKIVTGVYYIEIVDPTVTKIVSAIKSFFKKIANFLSPNKVEMINGDENKTKRKTLLDGCSKESSRLLDKIIKMDSFEFNGRTVLRFPSEVKDKLKVIYNDTEIALKNLSDEQLEESYQILCFLNKKSSQ